MARPLAVILLATAAVLAALPAATAGVHADHPKAEISIPAGSSVPGCEETNECNIPANVTIAVGGEVTWTNGDTAAHVVTSGTPDGGPDGAFDSGLFVPGATYTFNFEEAGTYPYYCIVHPWRTGVVSVDAVHAPEGGGLLPAWVMNTFQYYLDGDISDGEVITSFDFLIREGILQVTAPAEYVDWPMPAIKFVLSYYIHEYTTHHDHIQLIHALEHVIAHHTDMVAVVYRELGDRTGHVKVFYPNGTFAFNFGSVYGSDGYSFNGPFRVDVGLDGSVSVVVDRGRFEAYYPNGAVKFGLGPPGYQYDGHWRGAVDVAVGPDGRIFVLNDAIQAFHPNGTFAFDFVPQVDGIAESSIAVGPDGRIVVSGPNEIRVYHPNGTLAFDLVPHVSALGDFSLAPLSVGPDVAVGPDGRIVATRGGVWVYHPNGTFAFDLGPHAGGSDVAVGPDGRIFVSTPGPNFFGVVRVYHPNGTFAFDMAHGGAFDMAHGGAADIAVGPILSPAVFGFDTPPPITVYPSQGDNVNYSSYGDDVNLTIDVAGLAGEGGPPLNGSASSTVTFPTAGMFVATSFATVSFPPGVTAAHVPADGRLALRVAADVPDDARVQDALAYDGSGRVALQRVVEIGRGDQARVTFDMPVRILLEGQAGGRAFYIEGAAGAITPIDAACAADDTERVHVQLGGGGECQIDSGGGDKIIYTYHLTWFGTVSSEHSAPPPMLHTCSASLGSPSLDVRATPGERSPAVRQTLINSGSLPFAHASLTATPWSVVGASAPAMPAPPPAVPPPAPALGTDVARLSTVLTAFLVGGLPASVTEVSMTGEGVSYAPLADGTAVAHGLGGGDETSLWFRLNLSAYGDMQGGTLVQSVTYNAQCAPS